MEHDLNLAVYHVLRLPRHAAYRTLSCAHPLSSLVSDKHRRSTGRSCTAGKL